jgi:DNA polymerase I-like protein with 3'-5' exonuclease and polymerase domains
LQQEPRLLCSYAKDEAMLNAYRNKKDLYSTIAMGVYNNKYEDNLEHYPDGTLNSAGKERRSSCKSLLLGLMYGRGAASIAEQIGKPIQEAQKIIDNFYNSYPRVKEWMDKTLEDARVNGYVEDMWGRRRRLPDIQRPLVEVKYSDPNRIVTDGNFNPLIGSTGKYTTNTKSDIEVYRERALAARGRKEIEKIKAEAATKGIEVHENGGFIAQAERQCVNARIQGSASSMTKIAMIKVHADEDLKKLGFKLLICVHDELIGECPEENADEVADRLCWIMKTSVEDDVVTPFKCDPTVEFSWYLSDYTDVAEKDYNKFLEKGLTPEEAFSKVYEDRTECTEIQLKRMLNLI